MNFLSILSTRQKNSFTAFYRDNYRGLNLRDRVKPRRRWTFLEPDIAHETKTRFINSFSSSFFVFRNVHICPKM